jgi:hypothetical protein
MINNLIIIPYRDRNEHLKGFKEQTLPLFRKILGDFLLLIVEQDDDKLFNRGALINAGAREYLSGAKYIITHDVDFYPGELMIKTLYTTELEDSYVWGIYTSEWGTLAPIVKLNLNTFSMINGFPNNFWGWGDEDKALQNRAETYGLDIRKNKIMKDTNSTLKTESYTLRKDHHEDRPLPADRGVRADFEYQKFNSLTDLEKFTHINRSGMNNISYKITTDSQPEENVRHLKVNLSDFNP